MIANRFYPLGVNYKPYDAEVEYLEYTGTQWIDTGILAHAPLTFKCKARYGEKFSNSNEIWGCSVRTPTNHFTPFQGNNNLGLVVLGVSYTYTTSEERIFIKDKWATIYSVIDSPTSTLSFDGITVCEIKYLSPNSIDIDMSLPLFVRRHSVDGIVHGNSRLSIASCELSKDGIIVRDFIPVRVGDVGYMFDRVSGKLFGNQGTGAFILGPDK